MITIIIWKTAQLEQCTVLDLLEQAVPKIHLLLVDKQKMKNFMNKEHQTTIAMLAVLTFYDCLEYIRPLQIFET